MINLTMTNFVDISIKYWKEGDEIMSMLETFKTREAQENTDRKQKDLIGNSVAQVQEFIEITSNSTGKKWLILKSEVINCIPDKKGRDTTIELGDEISTFYDPTDDYSMQKLQDDLFTAGIEYDGDVETEQALLENICSASAGKLVYYNCYMGKKVKKEGEKFVEVEGQKSQRIKIKSKNLINEENSLPQIAV